MQITKVTSSDNELSYESGYIVSGHTVDYLVGRVLTLVETLGLKDTQEKALKDLIRQEIWAPFNAYGVTSIDGILHTLIVRAMANVREYVRNASKALSISKPVYELTVSEE